MRNKEKTILATVLLAMIVLAGVFSAVNVNNELSAAADETADSNTSGTLSYSGATILSINGTVNIDITGTTLGKYCIGIYCTGGDLDIKGKDSTSVLNIYTDIANTTNLSNTFGIYVNGGTLTINSCTVNIFVSGTSLGNRAIYTSEQDPA